ncbi:hypothetical protein LUU34_01607100 [Aix galericulata]|nr:hypothetical protein LUU34_01607100 [Aix galericulata]
MRPRCQNCPLLPHFPPGGAGGGRPHLLGSIPALRGRALLTFWAEKRQNQDFVEPPTLTPHPCPCHLGVGSGPPVPVLSPSWSHPVSGATITAHFGLKNAKIRALWSPPPSPQRPQPHYLGVGSGPSVPVLSPSWSHPAPSPSPRGGLRTPGAGAQPLLVPSCSRGRPPPGAPLGLGAACGEKSPGRGDPKNRAGVLGGKTGILGPPRSNNARGHKARAAAGDLRPRHAWQRRAHVLGRFWGILAPPGPSEVTGRG